MTNIDKLKSHWKSLQKPESTAEQHVSASNLINDFEKIQSKTKVENIICTIFFTLTIIAIWGMTYTMNEVSGWVYSGLIILTVEMILATGFAWYRNSLQKWGKLQEDNYTYLKAAIKKLKYRKFMTAYIIPIYSVLLITGINLIYIDVIDELSLLLRWVIHLGVSVLLAGFMAFEIRRRLKKQRKEIDPLIADLKAMKKGLE